MNCVVLPESSQRVDDSSGAAWSSGAVSERAGWSRRIAPADCVLAPHGLGQDSGGSGGGLWGRLAKTTSFFITSTRLCRIFNISTRLGFRFPHKLLYFHLQKIQQQTVTWLHTNYDKTMVEVEVGWRRLVGREGGGGRGGEGGMEGRGGR